MLFLYMIIKFSTKKNFGLAIIIISEEVVKIVQRVTVYVLPNFLHWSYLM